MAIEFIEIPNVILELPARANGFHRAENFIRRLFPDLAPELIPSFVRIYATRTEFHEAVAISNFGYGLGVFKPTEELHLKIRETIHEHLKKYARETGVNVDNTVQEFKTRFAEYIRDYLLDFKIPTIIILDMDTRMVGGYAMFAQGLGMAPVFFNVWGIEVPADYFPEEILRHIDDEASKVSVCTKCKH